ncbi:MAG: Orange carotenoid protein [Cyanothece sp. SIO2G6]|nr:Orange carotenoid protein [Cyanothece sp. SIO2G6]
MTFVTDRALSQSAVAFDAVEQALAAFNRLTVNDRLGVLWEVYTRMGNGVTPAATGAARLQFAQGLLDQVKQLSHEEQLRFMGDLVNSYSTPMTRAYGILTNNTKLAFWYQLAEMMQSGEVIPVPLGYKLSASARQVFSSIVTLEFGQQIAVLRRIVIPMGYDPLA